MDGCNSLGLIDTLSAARPQLPEELTDRQQDYSEPLLAIADLAGGDWPTRARGALIKLCLQEEDMSVRVKLLTAIRGIFDSTESDKLTTKDLLEALIEIEDGPWALMFEDHLKHDKLQSAAAKLARLLKDYKRPDGQKIKPHPIRIGDDVDKGFYRSDFEEAWKRYLQPSFPIREKAVTSVTSVTYDGKLESRVPNLTSGSVADPKHKPCPETRVSIVNSQNVSDVTDVTPFSMRAAHRSPGTTRGQFLAESMTVFNATSMSGIDALEKGTDDD